MQKLGPKLSTRTEKHLTRASLNWHVGATCIRVGGKWRYLRRAIDVNGQLVDFRLTAGRDAKAAKAFLKKAIERARLLRPVSICTDKAPTYRKVIRENDHAALKRLLGYRQSFRSVRFVKATLQGLKTIKTIKNGHIDTKKRSIRYETAFVNHMLGLIA